MSGDVQPRRRKDKRRKKDDEDGNPTTMAIRPLPQHTDNVTIHVHKDTGTGGHWCARIIFFGLLVALLVIIGLIIVEHRDSEDVNITVTALQWAIIFKDWVDDNPALHEEKIVSKKSITLHELNNNDEYENLESKKKKENKEKLEGIANKEGHGECFEMDEMVQKVTVLFQDNTLFEEELNEGLGLNQSDESKNEDTQKRDDENEVDLKEEAIAKENRDGSTERQFYYVFTDKDKADDDEGYSEEKFDNKEDLDALEEIEDDYNEDEIIEDFDIDLNHSIEGIKSIDDANDYINYDKRDIEEFGTISGVNEIDDNSAQPLEEIDMEEPEEIINEIINEEEVTREELKKESTSVTMKFGIGVALFVTAHFVLVRRWNNGSNEVPNLCGRNTLVQPIHVKIISKNKDKQQLLNKEQEETYNDIHFKYKRIGSKEKKFDIKEICAKNAFNFNTKLRNIVKDEEYSENVDDLNDENDYEDQEFEDDEIEEEEQKEEEAENIENINNIVLENIDKKYRKLSTLLYSEEEDESDNKDAKDEKNDKVSGWKSCRCKDIYNVKTELKRKKKLSTTSNKIEI